MAKNSVHFEYDHGPGGDYIKGMMEFCEDLERRGKQNVQMWDTGNGGEVEWDD